MDLLVNASAREFCEETKSDLLRCELGWGGRQDALGGWALISLRYCGAVDIRAWDEVVVGRCSNASFYSAHDSSSSSAVSTKLKSQSHKLAKPLKPPKQHEYVLLQDQIFTCTKQTAALLQCNSRCRFSKKEVLLKNKVQAYLKGFLQHNLHQRNKQALQEEKRELYHLLKEELGSPINLPDILRTLVHILQTNYQLLLRTHPAHQSALVKWKNSLLHQLQTAYTSLADIHHQVDHTNGPFYQQNTVRMRQSCENQELGKHLQAKYSQGQEKWEGRQEGSGELQKIEKTQYLSFFFNELRQFLAEEEAPTFDSIRFTLSYENYIAFQKKAEHRLLQAFGENEVNMHDYNKALFETLRQEISSQEPTLHAFDEAVKWLTAVIPKDKRIPSLTKFLERKRVPFKYNDIGFYFSY